MDITVAGQTVYAHTGGRPFDSALPAIVLIHGAGMDHTVWNQQTRYLAHHGASVLAVDLPGHGRSGGEPLTGIAAMADWIVQLLDAVGLSRAALVGHSMGALVAVDAAVRHGDRVRALGMIGVAEAMPVHPDLLASAKAGEAEAIELVIGWSHGRLGHVGGNAAPGMALMTGGRQLMQTIRPGVLGTDMAACDSYGSVVPAASQVKVPTLLLLGAEDRMTPARSGRKLSEHIPDNHLIIVPNIGHMVMTEAPDATIDALKTMINA